MSLETAIPCFLIKVAVPGWILPKEENVFYTSHHIFFTDRMKY